MSKLNEEQKEYIKGITSKKHQKKLKKAFKQSNKETEILNSVKTLKKFFQSIAPK